MDYYYFKLVVRKRESIFVSSFSSTCTQYYTFSLALNNRCKNKKETKEKEMRKRNKRDK